MKNQKGVLKAFLLLFVFGVGAPAFAQKAAENKDLPNFYQVNAKLYRGGQPTEAGVRQLAKMGVKTIIDLRGEDKRSRAEEIWAKTAGLKFVSVSLENWFKPKRSQIDDILKEIDRAEDQPVFVHCRRGADRTGTVIAAYRISRDGWTDEQATEEAKKFGFGWWQFWMKDFIHDYYESNGKRKLENGK